jgi:hypothetical protein
MYMLFASGIYKAKEIIKIMSLSINFFILSTKPLQSILFRFSIIYNSYLINYFY